ncbi:hypothetical protein FRC10_004586 [Ceratobasidium sp. 414]|nr:hypothetical protein FRC10_004586 [Ceratobasidium sp. 414]
MAHPILYTYNFRPWVQFGGYVMGLNDFHQRVNDNTLVGVLNSDIELQKVDCQLWNMQTGGVVLDLSSSPLWKPLAHGDLENYQRHWVLCFDGAIEIANAMRTQSGAFNVLSRFYEPRGNTTFQLYFMPGEFVTLQQLKEALADFKSTQGVSLHLMLDPSSGRQMTERDAERKGYIKLSMNPLGLYSTWIRPSDLDKLMQEQTGRDDTWVQPLPAFHEARALHQSLLQHRASEGYDYSRSKSEENIPFLQYPGENLWAFGRLGWKSDSGPSAEWLHLIAHRFHTGIGDRFNNLIFGTVECNTDMMRAEAAVTQLLHSARVHAVGVRSVLAYGLKKIQLSEERPFYEKNVTWILDHEWRIGVHPHWLTAKLEYKIQYYLSAGYELDKVLLEKYLKGLAEPDILFTTQKSLEIVHNYYGISAEGGDGGSSDGDAPDLEDESESESEGDGEGDSEGGGDSGGEGDSRGGGEYPESDSDESGSEDEFKVEHPYPHPDEDEDDGYIGIGDDDDEFVVDCPSPYLDQDEDGGEREGDESKGEDEDDNNGEEKILKYQKPPNDKQEIITKKHKIQTVYNPWAKDKLNVGQLDSNQRNRGKPDRWTKGKKAEMHQRRKEEMSNMELKDDDPFPIVPHLSRFPPNL